MVVKPVLSVSARFERQSLPQNHEAETVLMVSVAATSGDAGMNERRRGVNLIIVLDRSASMNDQNKLELCKKTIAFLCDDLLTDVDRLGLVTFDSEPKVEFPCSYMTPENKRKLLAKLKSIVAGDHTNLSGGIFQGFDMLRTLDGRHPEDVNAMLVLSDGEATSGITDRAKLVRITKNVAESFGDIVPMIHTFGYGAVFDPVLRDIPATVGGTFYHVQDVEHVPLAFADSLGGLLTVAAQNLSIDLTLEGGGGAVFSTSSLTTCRMELASATQCRLKLRDLYAGEHKDLLIKVRMPPMPGTNSIVQCSVQARFLDLGKERFESLETHALLERLLDAEVVVLGGDDVEVARQVLRVEAANAIQVAKVAVESGDVPSSLRAIDASLVNVQGRMSELRLDPERDEMMRDVLEDLRTTQAALRSAVTPQQYVSSGMSSTMHEMSWSHQQQRSVFSSNVPNRSAYQTNFKKNLASRTKANFSAAD